MDKGTEAYFVWEQRRRYDAILEAILEFHRSQYPEVAVRKTGPWYSPVFRHPDFGDFTFQCGDVGAEGDEVLLQCHDYDALPDFNDDDPQAQAVIRVMYRYIKGLFVSLEADLCIGSTMMNEMGVAELVSVPVFQMFRFARVGPQLLIRPYEEDREIRLGETSSNAETGEKNWKMFVDGPLPLAGGKEQADFAG